MAEVASAFVTLVPTAKGFGSKLSRELDGPTSKAGTQGGKKYAAGMSSGLKGAGAKIFAPLAAAAAAIGVGNFLKDAIGEARQSQKVGALTAQVIKSTGSAAKVTAGQVGDLATAISNKTGIDDEAIQSASNLLLTFTNVRNEVGKGNDVFNQATQAATDLGAAMGNDPKAAAIQLGKALNDPVKGITALTRVGVSFTAEQKKQIGTLVKSGDTLSAQKIILSELRKEFGGAAAASATSGEKLSVAFGNFKEQIGTALLPVIDKVENAITTKVIPAISGFITGIQNGTGAGGRFRAFAVALFTILKAVGGFIAGKVVPVLAGLAARIRDGSKAGGGFRDIIGAVAGFFRDRLVPAIQGLVAKILPALKGLFASVSKTMQDHAGVIKFVGAIFKVLGLVVTDIVLPVLGEIAKLLLTVLGPAFRVVVAIIDKVVLPAIRLLVKIFLDQIGRILDVASVAFGWIPGLGPKLKSAAAAFKKFKDQVNNELAGVKDRDVKVVAKGYTQVATGKFKGKVIPIGLARGGSVFGPGTETSDSIPALLSRNEHVWTAAEVRGAGGHERVEALRQMAKAGRLNGYAQGGPITDFPPRFNKAIDARLIPKARAYFEKVLRDQEGSGTFVRGNGVGSRASLLAFARLISGMGYSVTEGPPPFGPVHRVHAPNSRHYLGRAIDVNHGAGTSALEQAFLRRIIPLSRTYGLDSIFMQPGHYNHAHFQYDQGGWLQPGRTMVENKTGKPEAVFNQQQLAALTAGRSGVTITGDIYDSSPRKLLRDVQREQKRHEALHPVY